MTPGEAASQLRELGFIDGEMVALAISRDAGIGLSYASERIEIAGTGLSSDLRELTTALAARWVWWDRTTSDLLAANDTVIDRCWDILTVHRLLHGGWKTSVGLAWAWLHDLSSDSLPQMGQLGLLDAPTDEGAEPENPIRPDGHLRPEWCAGGWETTTARLSSWASLALQAQQMQEALIDAMSSPRRVQMTARSESAADMLCAELELDGLPLNTGSALAIISTAAGPKPANYAEEDVERARRDAEVLKHLSPPQDVNLRNPAEVKAMLRRAGLDLPDTRAWRLESLRESEPLIDALLHWRKAERIATTYGYQWLEEHVRDGRLRGEWSSSDGAAGRMTASAGLHNLPAPMRPAIAADPGYQFVRADLGQIEPRVLAAVSGDESFIAATQNDDLYQPVAERLAVERDIAKVAVLGAMYGATTGESAGALRGLERNYPVAMKMLEEAAEAGRLGQEIFTAGGRRIRMWVDPSVAGNIDRAITVAASRGRFARNALIQGAAAEFFKVWAITVRRQARQFDAKVVLCLHDELLVHVPEAHAEHVATLVESAVGEAAHYWSPEPRVRFVADVSIVDRWSDAKS